MVLAFEDAPVLPPEIERHIFELCALGRPALVPKLILVAWRVKQWYVALSTPLPHISLELPRIEPFLYRTVILGEQSPIDGYPGFTSEILLSAIRTKPPGFIARAVRNLSIYDSSTAGYAEILAACTGATNLRILSFDASFSAHIPSSLTQLYVYDFPHQSTCSFSQLTHLDVMSNPDIDLDAFYSFVALLLRLTHISFSNADYAPLFLRLLRNCPPKIEVLFYCDDTEQPLADQESLAEDLRFVVIRIRELRMLDWAADWLMGVHCDRDYWYRAERFIQKRRSGDVDRRQSIMSRENWLDCA
ncbi:hypothetical protein FB45DRAFT_1062623 [Roridomyces roridus]|uniref:Uncharacterized protein n=1 Tax=Roridomyces roridus TaxID=1738132 RepID=A0AAD7BGB5_9AGAR|nr:hypothetical protein FB45DRAFT_1062623 [Roridomyces roridus]